MIDYFTWPWLFAMPIAFAVVGLALSLRYVTNTREDHGGRFDILGSFLSAIAIGAIVLGIHEGPEAGWTSPLALAGILVSVVVAFAAFIWHETRASSTRCSTSGCSATARSPPARSTCSSSSP